MDEITSERLRAATVVDDVNERPAPRLGGKLLGAIERGRGERLYITWDEYRGTRFIRLQIWTENGRGEWWPTSKQIVVRTHELPAFAGAVADGLDEAGKIQEGARAGHTAAVDLS